MDTEGKILCSRDTEQSRASRNRNDPPTEAETTSGTNILLHGTSSSLKSLRARVLAELCTIHLKDLTAEEYYTSNRKSELLSKLEAYVSPAIASFQRAHTENVPSERKTLSGGALINLEHKWSGRAALLAWPSPIRL